MIMVVDDEPMVGTMTGHCVKRAGYKASVFDQPEAAVAWFTNHHDMIALVITDHNMPGMTGVELAQELERISAATPVIICSGYVDAIEENVDDLTNVKAIMSKPTPTPTLLAAIEQHLANK